MSEPTKEVEDIEAAHTMMTGEITSLQDQLKANDNDYKPSKDQQIAELQKINTKKIAEVEKLKLQIIVKDTKRKQKNQNYRELEQKLEEYKKLLKETGQNSDCKNREEMNLHEGNTREKKKRRRMNRAQKKAARERKEAGEAPLSLSTEGGRANSSATAAAPFGEVLMSASLTREGGHNRVATNTDVLHDCALYETQAEDIEGEAVSCDSLTEIAQVALALEGLGEAGNQGDGSGDLPTDDFSDNMETESSATDATGSRNLAGHTHVASPRQRLPTAEEHQIDVAQFPSDYTSDQMDIEPVGTEAASSLSSPENQSDMEPLLMACGRKWSLTKSRPKAEDFF